MENNPSFGKSISIDINAVTGKSISEESVKQNLEQLQRHVFGGHWERGAVRHPRSARLPRASDTEASSDEQTTASVSTEPVSGKTVQNQVRKHHGQNVPEQSWKQVNEGSTLGACFKRGDSVDDEDLFGPGNGGSANLVDQVVSQLTRISESEVMDPDDADSNVLPDFAGLGFEGFTSLTEATYDTGKVDSTEANASGGCEVDPGVKTSDESSGSLGEDSMAQVRVTYRSKRSISDSVSRRRDYGRRSDIEIYDDYVPEEVHSPEDLEMYRRSNSLPDVISSSSLKSLSDGSNQSPSPDVTHFSSSSDSSCLEKLHQKKSLKDEFEGHSSIDGKPRLKRMVSFNEEVQYRELSENEGSGDSGQDETRRRSSSSEKRHKYSETSSGYHTGSDAGSQDKKLQSQNSQSDVSSTWASAEESPEIPCPESRSDQRSEDKINSDASADDNNSDNSHSSSSLNTVVSTDDKKYSDLEFRRLRVEPGSMPDSNKCLKPGGPESATPSKSLQDSAGNLPNILPNDSSFTLRPSMLKKVEEEEDHQLKKVQQIYTRDGPASSDGSSGHHELNSGRYSLLQQPKSDNQWEEFNRRFLEEMLTDETCSPSNLLPIMTVGHSDSSTPGFSPYVFDQRSQTGRRLSPDLISFTEQDLEKSSRCYMQNCKESCCLKLQNVFRILAQQLPNVDPSYNLVKSYCLALYRHAGECWELACPVIFCPLIAKWIQGTSEVPITSLEAQEMISKNIQKLVKEPVTEAVEGKYKQLIRLQPNVDPPEDFVTHVPLSRLGKFGSAILCQGLSGYLCAVKKYSLFEESHQLSVYSSLVQLSHPYIVTHFWLLETEETFQVCTLFMQGGSLRSHLEVMTLLPWETTLFYMRQILAAITYLHQHLGIVYLNWTSSNMLFPSCSRNVVKITDFSLSVPLRKLWDAGSVKESLPSNICPPELLQHNNVSVKSDTWGAGCLIAELLSGQPVCHKLRHRPREEIHKAVWKHSLKVEGLKDDQLTLLREYCWQKEDKRKTCEQLEEKLQSLARSLTSSS